MLKTMDELALRQPSTPAAAEEDAKSEGSSKKISPSSSVSDMSELLEETGGYLGGMFQAMSGAVGLSNADPSLPEPSAEEIARNAAIMAELGLSTGKLEEGYLTADLTGGSQKTTPRAEEPQQDGEIDYWETGTTAPKPMKKSSSVSEVQEIAATSVKAHILGLSTAPPVRTIYLCVLCPPADSRCRADDTTGATRDGRSIGPPHPPHMRSRRRGNLQPEKGAQSQVERRPPQKQHRRAVARTRSRPARA